MKVQSECPPARAQICLLGIMWLDGQNEREGRSRDMKSLQWMSPELITFSLNFS